MLVHDSIKHHVSILSKPTYGETEGVTWIKVDHGRSSRYDVFCSLYLEQQRKRFKTDNEEIFDGIKRDWERYAKDAYNVFIVGDLNTRVGQLQENRLAGYRQGEPYLPNAQGRNLVTRLRAMDAAIVHGRLCECKPTYEPCDKRKLWKHESICDYMILRRDRLKHVTACAIDDDTAIGSDHNLLWLSLDYNYNGEAPAGPSLR